MNQKPRILYAEDDETLAFLTVDNLLQHQYSVDHFANGALCLQAFQNSVYDLCILDVMLPGLDGFALAQEIRKVNQNIPILFLSAKVMKEDRIKGLRLGADDYLVKPFSIEELVLKIEVFINRSQKRPTAQKAQYHGGNFEFYPEQFMLRQGAEKTVLTQREAELLKYFLDHKNEVLKRDQILTALWGKDDYFLGRSLDVFVSRLRKLFAKDATIKIENLHGIGFKFVEHRSDASL
ncbi:MAG: response regulator transcription factor [Bacteroidota bacterium]